MAKISEDTTAEFLFIMNNYIDTGNIDKCLLDMEIHIKKCKNNEILPISEISHERLEKINNEVEEFMEELKGLNYEKSSSDRKYESTNYQDSLGGGASGASSSGDEYNSDDYIKIKSAGGVDENSHFLTDFLESTENLRRIIGSAVSMAIDMMISSLNGSLS